MIADLDETIKQLLIEELPVKNGEIDISFDQPKREWSARLNKPTANLFLYDVRENPQLRSHQWERMSGGGNGQAVQKRSPMRVDCFYMLTTWANEPEDEHRLLTRALMALFKFPILPADRLLGTLQNPAFDIQARLANHDRLTNPAEVWSALDNEMRPSVSYIVTLALDPWSEVSGPIVRTLTLVTGHARELPRYPQLDTRVAATELYFVGGTVRSSSKGEEPLAGLQVAIKGSGWTDTTDVQGRYRLGSMPPGEHTLIVWPEKGKPVEKVIQLGRPVDDGDFDLAI